jgi:NADPH:quinone reductase-like Zn-dependent oxidoreductase
MFACCNMPAYGKPATALQAFVGYFSSCSCLSPVGEHFLYCLACTACLAYGRSTTPFALQFTGKVAIVTGGSTGMGLAVSQQLAAEGASVIIAGRTQSKLDAAVKLIKEAGGEVHAVAANVGSDADNKRIVDTALELYGRVDISFVNAGTYGGAGFSEASTQCNYCHHTR